jgi:REP element-mobilizing transposase RayT
MSRPHRHLTSRGVYHVYNRTLARRTAFERREDFRAFMCLAALATRRYGIRVLAYCLMPTHVHLVLEAPADAERLSDAMAFLESQYTRYFNRGRKRDGPLWRGRFKAKLVTDSLYRIILVRYIDANPVQARIVGAARHYPYGSAVHYQRPRGPLWLSRETVEQTVCEVLGTSTYHAEDYNRLFAVPARGHEQELVRLRMTSTAQPASTQLSDLVRAAPDAVRDWMQRKARLADGTSAGLPVAAPAALQRAARSIPWSEEPRSTRRGRPGGEAGDVALVGLLRDAGALSLQQIAGRAGSDMSKVRRYLAIHRRRMLCDSTYADAITRALQEAMRTTFEGLPDAWLGRLAGRGTVVGA